LRLEVSGVLSYNNSFTERIMQNYCVTCSDVVAIARWRIGYHTCLQCGEKQARAFKHCIVPMAKSNYQPITDLATLKQLNKYARV